MKTNVRFREKIWTNRQWLQNVENADIDYKARVVRFVTLTGITIEIPFENVSVIEKEASDGPIK
jgi:hypothetical protein